MDDGFAALSPTEQSRLANSTISGGTEREYLVKLEGPISSPDVLQSIARISGTPKVVKDDGATAQFCCIDGRTKDKITKWLDNTETSFVPTFIFVDRAPKDLDSNSAAPILGVDTTMPQNRLPSRETTPRSSQDEYPVWYFFYGTLTDPDTLRHVFREIDDKDTSYVLHPAKVYGGRLTTWADEYKALVDDQGLYPAEPVLGRALLVVSQDHEDASRYHETHMYEVVRCQIQFDDEGRDGVDGCTFRFREQD